MSCMNKTCCYSGGGRGWGGGWTLCAATTDALRLECTVRPQYSNSNQYTRTLYVHTPPFPSNDWYLGKYWPSSNLSTEGGFIIYDEKLNGTQVKKLHPIIDGWMQVSNAYSAFKYSLRAECTESRCEYWDSRINYYFPASHHPPSRLKCQQKML